MTAMTKTNLNRPTWRGTEYLLRQEEPVALVRSKKPRLLVGGKETWLPARAEVIVYEELTLDGALWLKQAVTEACADLIRLDADYPANTPAEATPQ